MYDGTLFAVTARVVGFLRRLGSSALLDEMSESEARSYAAGIAYMVRARLWTLLNREPSWTVIDASWARGSKVSVNGTLSAEDRVRLTTDGEAAFADRAALYTSAARQIDIATYYIQADATGRATAEALAACAARGVRVRFLVDGFMTFKKTQEVAGTEDLLDLMRRSGIAVKVWHDPARPYDSNHRKIIVIDERVALVGGRNFADHYRGNAWRDVDMVIEGPSVKPLAALFETVWATPTSESGRSHSTGPWVDRVPKHVLADPIVLAVLGAIDHARHRADLELSYFVGNVTLCAALCRAARRGVHVRLLTNSAESTDLPFLTWTAYEGIRRLLEAGCVVYTRQGAGRTLHGKYIVVDDEWVTMGSHNLDYYSARYCCETNLVARDALLAAALRRYFDEGIGDAVRATPEAVRAVLSASHVSRAFDRVFRDFQ